MFLSIINFLEVSLKEMEQNIKDTLSSKKDVADVVLVVQEFVNKLGTDIVKEVIEEVDEGIRNSPHRKGKWEIVRSDENTLLTSMGNMTY